MLHFAQLPDYLDCDPGLGSQKVPTQETTVIVRQKSQQQLRLRLADSDRLTHNFLVCGADSEREVAFGAGDSFDLRVP